MDMNSVTPIPHKAPALPADEYEAAIASAQEGLQRASQRVGPHGDEGRLWLIAQADTLGALLKTTKRWEQATAQIIESRETFGEAERARLIRDVISANQDTFATEVRKRMERMIRTFDRRTTALIGSYIGGAFVGGALISALTVTIAFWGSGAGPWSANAAWAELARYNPDPRPALASAGDRTAADGRHYKIISLWIEPPKAPPTTGNR